MKTVNLNKPDIQRVVTPEDLARAALDMFLKEANEAISSKGVFNVAISGGQTPTRFFELLGQTDESLSLEWTKVQVFWVDERCVSPDADASNYHLAAQTFLDKVSLPSENIHRVSGEFTDYAEAVREYQATIRNLFKLKPGEMPVFDLIVLGMGPDGHIGSLVPDSYALFDTEDIVSVVYLTDGDYSRITLTHPVLCAARHLIILVSGVEKAHILHDVLTSQPDSVKYPVHTLWPILNKVTWIVDKGAGKYL